MGVNEDIRPGKVRSLPKKHFWKYRRHFLPGTAKGIGVRKNVREISSVAKRRKNGTIQFNLARSHGSYVTRIRVSNRSPPTLPSFQEDLLEQGTPVSTTERGLLNIPGHLLLCAPWAEPNWALGMCRVWVREN